MKRLISILLILTFFSACKKDASREISNGTVVGKWQVINDSSAITGSLNGFNGGSNYIGTPHDYFNFTSNGDLFVREGQSMDTATYTLSPNRAQVNILFSYVGGITVEGNAEQPFNITNLTSHRLTLTLPDSLPTPEGYIHRIINLQK